MEERLERFIEQKAGNRKMFYFGCRIEPCKKVSEFTCDEFMKIHSVFPELNFDWLITGREPMMFSENKNP